MYKKKSITFLLVFCLFFMMSTFLTSSFAQNAARVEYEPTDEIFPNPERGFSLYRYTPVTVGVINSLREEGISIVQRIYTIPEFNNKPLSQNFLSLVESDLNTARQGGAKLVMRFSYTSDIDGADAPLVLILSQIDQLKEILQTNYDVIAYIEAGFIGAWGEWYFSSNGLNNTEDRRTILFALLDALPTKRAVAIRTPDYKRLIYGTSEPLNEQTAFSGENIARTGAHNDCFLANATDYGTYIINQIQQDKEYWSLDNRFVPQGGETCSPSDFTTCTNALIDMELMHWSVLNKDYHPEVLQEWRDGGCMDEIKRRLGYRFELVDGTFSNKVRPGSAIDINLTITNLGFASPYNPRNLEFILRETTTKKKYRVLTDEEPRFWFGGDTINVNFTAGVTNEMPEGSYELLMHLADPEPRLHDRPEYSMRLANEDVWEDSTGYNSLKHTIQVDGNIQADPYTGDFIFEEVIPTGSEETTILIDGEFDDWKADYKIDNGNLEEEAGDALTESVDIVDCFVTDDEENVYLSYSLNGPFTSPYFYHVLFDVDRNTSTGFHMNGSYAGIDLMIENEQLWKYNGTNGEWSWEAFGGFTSATGSNEPNRIEIAIAKEMLNELNSSESFEFILNVNDLDNTVDDDYAPDSYQTQSYIYEYSVTSLENITGNENPQETSISAYPNPFNNQVNITFNLSNENVLSGSIYNMIGERVKTFGSEEMLSSGIQWKGDNDYGYSIGSGIYIFMLVTTGGSYFSKLMLLK